MRTSGRSSPWQRARRSSNGDGETCPGGSGLMAAALWRVRSVGEVERRSAGAQMRERERASGVLGSSGRGQGGCELHARRGRGDRGNAQLGRQLRGDEGADSPRPTGRESGGASADAGKAAALMSGPARAERGEGGKARARGGPGGPKGRGGEGSGLLFLFLLFWHLFSLFFLFTLFDSILNVSQIQTSTPKYYVSNKSEI